MPLNGALFHGTQLLTFRAKNQVQSILSIKNDSFQAHILLVKDFFWGFYLECI